MRKHWMWSLGIVVCLVPILAAQEIYKEMILFNNQSREADAGQPAAEETASECPHAGTPCVDEKAAVPNPQDVARRRQQELADAVSRFNKLVEQEQYTEAREVARDVIEAMPEHPVATLMWSKIQWIEKYQELQRPAPTPSARPEPAKDWDQLSAERKASRAKKIQPGPASAELVTITYPVADLVIPIPKKVTLSIDGDAALKPEPKAEAEYEPLLKLIQESVAPTTWSEAGGQASLRPFEPTLSLVVRQTPEAQEQIDDLLTALRRLQDVQLAYEIRVLSLPAEDDNWLTEYNQTCQAELNWDNATQVLNPKQTAQLVQQTQNNPRSNIVMAPKVTLLNGQVLDLQLGNAGLLKCALMHGVISDDRRTVRLNTALNCTSVEEVVAATFQSKLADGSSLLLNPHLTSETVRNPQGTPILNKVPYVSRLFKDTAVVEKTRLVVLVTPRIIVQEEEEELLNATFPLPGGDQSDRKPVIIPASGVMLPDGKYLETEPESLSTPETRLPIPLPAESQTLPSPEYLEDDIQYFPAPAPSLPAPQPVEPQALPLSLDLSLPLPANETPPETGEKEPAAEEPANADVRFFLGLPR